MRGNSGKLVEHTLSIYIVFGCLFSFVSVLGAFSSEESIWLVTSIWGAALIISGSIEESANITYTIRKKYEGR